MILCKLDQAIRAVVWHIQTSGRCEQPVIFHNVLRYPDRFPKADFYFVTRDPCDAVASAKTQGYLKTQITRKMDLTWNQFTQAYLWLRNRTEAYFGHDLQADSA